MENKMKTVAAVVAPVTDSAKKIKRSKVVDGKLDNEAVSLLSLKDAKSGDWLLFLDDSGKCTMFTVLERTGQRGRNGGTTMVLQDYVNEDCLVKLGTTNSLPDGVIMVRKISKGVNERTLKTVIPDSVSSVSAIQVPVQTFESVVDSVIATQSEAQETNAPVSETAVQESQAESAPESVQASSEPVVDSESAPEVSVAPETPESVDTETEPTLAEMLAEAQELTGDSGDSEQEVQELQDLLEESQTMVSPDSASN